MTRFEIKVVTAQGRVLDHLKNASEQTLDKAIDMVETNPSGGATTVEYRRHTRKNARPQTWTRV